MAITNKAHIAPVPTERYVISTNDVVNYLENEVLGFKIGYDFTRWTGATPEQSYVRMRTVIRPSDILAPVNNDNYVDRVLNDNAAGLRFKDNVIKLLEPFMFPKTTNNLQSHPEDMQRLYQLGLFGERLDEVIKNAQLNYSQEHGYFRLYLRPERIIADMLADPATNQIDGTMQIVAVHGTTPETIRWEVEVTKSSTFMSGSNISIDAIYNK